MNDKDRRIEGLFKYVEHLLDIISEKNKLISDLQTTVRTMQMLNKTKQAQEG